jgi:hypothetical protein
MTSATSACASARAHEVREHHQRRRMPLAALVVTLAVIAVAGCSDPGPGPTTTPPAVTSTAPSPATGTPSPTASGPDIPAAARTQDEAGGVAFVKFFIDQVNESYTTPRNDLIPALSDPGCKSCVSLQKTAGQYVASSSRTSAGPYSVTNVEWIGEQAAGVFIITMTLKTAPVDTIDSTGMVVSTYEEDSTKRRIGVTWKEGQWVVYGAASSSS